jgi:hypothetical protein
VPASRFQLSNLRIVGFPLSLSFHWCSINCKNLVKNCSSIYHHHWGCTKSLKAVVRGPFITNDKKKFAYSPCCCYFLYDIKIKYIGLALNVTKFKRFVKLDKLLFLRKESMLVMNSGSHRVHWSFSLARKASNLLEFFVDRFSTPFGQVPVERCRKGLKLG